MKSFPAWQGVVLPALVASVYLAWLAKRLLTGRW